MRTRNQTTAKTRALVRGAIIAAIYTALTLLFAPISYGEVQIRIAESLTLLPILLPEAVPALTIGCLLFNLSYAAALPLDAIVGTAASFLATGAMWLTRKITIKGYPLPGLLMPALFNALLVGWELSVYIGGGFGLNALYVAIGEAAVLLSLGAALYYAIRVRRLDKRLFG